MNTKIATTARRFAFALLTAIGFILMEAISGVQAAAPDFSQAEPAAVVEIPSWDDVAEDFPRCESVQVGTDSLETIAVVADAQTGDVSKMSVGDVWQVALDKDATNDVWTLGLCR